MVTCEDCGLEYDRFEADTTLPDSQWFIIHPENEGRGILCANCMVRRASKLPGFIAARMILEFGPGSRESSRNLPDT